VDFFSYFLAVVAAIGAICVAFDSATSQWLVQKVLNQLSTDVLKLENNLKVLNGQLEEGRIQIDEREAQLQKSAQQLQESAQQLAKQKLIISDLTLVQGNMSALLTSLMAAQQDGVNLNELLRQNLNKFEQLLNNMTEYANKNHLVDKQRGGGIFMTSMDSEFHIYRRMPEFR
jgi:DNA repair exonuclease SbcCD ATPase subunit